MTSMPNEFIHLPLKVFNKYVICHIMVVYDFLNSSCVYKHVRVARAPY
jgi:hypothetical protein